MKKFPISLSTATFSIIPLILLFSNSAFSTDELVNETEDKQVPILLDPLYNYYLEDLQGSSDEDLLPNDEYELGPRSSEDLEDMPLEKRGGMWKFRSGKRGGELWKFRGGKRDNLWKFRGGKRADSLWKFRGGKRGADLWKFRGGKRESLWKLRGGKRGGSIAAWKLRSG